MSAQRGFTLLELLVASAILVVLGLTGYVALNIVLRVAEESEGHSARLEQVQRCFTLLALDLEQILDRPIRDEFGDQSTALKYVAGTGELEFTRAGWPNPAAQPRSSLQRVAYALEDRRLWRRYWRELDRLQGTEPVRRLLLDDVQEITFRFLDTTSQWRDQWPPLAGESLVSRAVPRAVEITIELADWGEIRRVYALPG